MTYLACGSSSAAGHPDVVYLVSSLAVMLGLLWWAASASPQVC